MNWIQRMLAGRHGADELSIFILILAFVLMLPASFFSIVVYTILEVLSIALMAYGFYRMFSRNHAARYAENMKFLKVWNPVMNWFKMMAKRFRERKTHKYFRCPKCSKMLRVPKGIGKVNITCPTCHEKFIRKS